MKTVYTIRIPYDEVLKNLTDNGLYWKRFTDENGFVAVEYYNDKNNEERIIAFRGAGDDYLGPVWCIKEVGKSDFKYWWCKMLNNNADGIYPYKYTWYECD